MYIAEDLTIKQTSMKMSMVMTEKYNLRGAIRSLANGRYKAQLSLIGGEIGEFDDVQTAGLAVANYRAEAEFNERIQAAELALASR